MEKAGINVAGDDSLQSNTTVQARGQGGQEQRLSLCS